MPLIKHNRNFEKYAKLPCNTGKVANKMSDDFL